MLKLVEDDAPADIPLVDKSKMLARKKRESDIDLENDLHVKVWVYGRYGVSCDAQHHLREYGRKISYVGFMLSKKRSYMYMMFRKKSGRLGFIREIMSDFGIYCRLLSLDNGIRANIAESLILGAGFEPLYIMRNEPDKGFADLDICSYKPSIELIDAESVISLESAPEEDLNTDIAEPHKSRSASEASRELCATCRTSNGCECKEEWAGGF